MNIHRIRHQNDSLLRMLFSWVSFSVSSLIIYFTLGHVYGFYGNGLRLAPSFWNAHLLSHSNYVLLNQHSYYNHIQSTDYFQDPIKMMILNSWLLFSLESIDSLKRLMDSLLSWLLESFRQTPIPHWFWPEDEVLKYVESFKWPFGDKSIVKLNKKVWPWTDGMKSWPAQNDKNSSSFWGRHWSQFEIFPIRRGVNEEEARNP